MEGDIFIFNEGQKKLSETELEQLVEADVSEWARIKSSKKIDDWVSYLRTFPNGRFAEIAQLRLARLLAEDEKLAAEKRQGEEQQRIEQESIARERKRVEEEQRLAAEHRKLDEEQRQEARRLEEEQKRLSQQKRRDQEHMERERARLAKAQLLAAERKQLEEQQLQEKRRREEEQQRLEAMHRQEQERLEREHQRIVRPSALLRSASNRKRNARRPSRNASSKISRRKQQPLFRRPRPWLPNLPLRIDITPDPVDCASGAPAVDIRPGLPVPALITPSANPYSAGHYRLGRIYTVGDEASIRQSDFLTGVEERTYKWRVTGVNYDQDRVEFNNGNSITDLMGNTIKNGAVEFDTPVQFIPAEFQLGKKWTAAFRRTKDGTLSNAYYDLQITKRETITVPAGTFDTFLVEGNGWNMTFGARLETRLWLVPGLNFAIKRENVNRNKWGRFAQTEKHELVALSQHVIGSL